MLIGVGLDPELYLSSLKSILALLGKSQGRYELSDIFHTDFFASLSLFDTCQHHHSAWCVYASYDYVLNQKIILLVKCSMQKHILKL